METAGICEQLKAVGNVIDSENSEEQSFVINILVNTSSSAVIFFLKNSDDIRFLIDNIENVTICNIIEIGLKDSRG